jgi:hypothetical protein
LIPNDDTDYSDMPPLIPNDDDDSDTDYSDIPLLIPNDDDDSDTDYSGRISLCSINNRKIKNMYILTIKQLKIYPLFLLSLPDYADKYINYLVQYIV